MNARDHISDFFPEFLWIRIRWILKRVFGCTRSQGKRATHFWI